MRQTKFRAQEILSSKNKWVYGDYFSQWKEGETKHYIVEHPNGRDAGRDIMWEVKPETLGEYAGFKDKNGVEIYGGDIVRRDAAITIVAGIEKPDEYPAVVVECETDYVAGYIGFPMFDPCEVIGNIHSNPELPK